VALSDDAVVSELAWFYDGQGYLSHLKALVDALQLQDVVRWRGQVPFPDLPAHYRRADLLVNPSLSEAFGVSLIEAMATEVPVVASRVGGMSQVVAEGETGLLVEAGNAAALAGAICGLLDDADRRRSMRKAGRRRVLERFSWERVLPTLSALYERLCVHG
jgi:glycosyltransferase involved in cell wall biosynthesis